MPGSRPLFSVVIPTFRRPGLLRRAIGSTLAQTCVDWELIVSDDEYPSGDAWAMVSDLARHDSRIRLFRNDAIHGQAPNLNNALRHARGAWIKPLYDDDELEPACLETFAAALAPSRGVTLAACLATEWTDGAETRRPRTPAGPSPAWLSSAMALRAMYLHDLDIGIPSQVAIHRSAVEQGILMEEPPGIHYAGDSWWFARLLQKGDLLLLPQALVRQHQGAHDSLTRQALSSEQNQRRMDEEIALIKRWIRPMLEDPEQVPPLETALAGVRLIRGINRWYKGRHWQSLRMLATTWRPGAWWLGIRWLMRKARPGQWDMVPRQESPWHMMQNPR